jgi:hypothetical protein
LPKPRLRLRQIAAVVEEDTELEGRLGPPRALEQPRRVFRPLALLAVEK